MTEVERVACTTLNNSPNTVSCIFRASILISTCIEPVLEFLNLVHLFLRDSFYKSNTVTQAKTTYFTGQCCILLLVGSNSVCVLKNLVGSPKIFWVSNPCLCIHIHLGCSRFKGSWTEQGCCCNYIIKTVRFHALQELGNTLSCKLENTLCEPFIQDLKHLGIIQRTVGHPLQAHISIILTIADTNHFVKSGKLLSGKNVILKESQVIQVVSTQLRYQQPIHLTHWYDVETLNILSINNVWTDDNS